MVFSKFTELISSKTNSSSVPKNASSNSHKASRLPPLPGGTHYGYKYSIPQKKNHMRLSTSLQDLSIYRELDQESDIFPAVDPSLPRILTNENGSSSFSKEKITTVIPSRRKWLRVLCVLLCLLIVACLGFSVQYLFSNWVKGPSNYYIVLDCGSTGTRVYVYEASSNRQKDDSLPISLKSLPEEFSPKPASQSGRAYSRMETEPGLDKLVGNASGLRLAMEPLIEWAEKQIPKASHKTASLFLYATAGVRRLPSSDSKWILDNVWSILKSSSPFTCKKEWVKIISGTEEAYFGWIALNYHTRILGSLPKKETYGALDLGGSSLQVTFEGQQPSGSDDTNLELSIGSVNHRLSAYSLAGYGLNDAFDKSVAYLVKSRVPKVSYSELVRGKVEIDHPCLNSGYKEKYICSNCVSAFTSDGNAPIEGEKSAKKGANDGVKVQLIGAPKWDECSKLARVAVNFSEWSNNINDIPSMDCEVQPCALTPNLPRPVGQFYAMSGFFVVYRFFNVSPDATLDDLLEKGREFCLKPWDAAKESVAPQPFIEQYCFRAPYVSLLLREGLHISDKNVIIGSGSITWTLGVALYEAGKDFPRLGRFYGYEVMGRKLSPFAVLTLAFSLLFVVVFCALFCLGNWWVPPKFFWRRSYLPLFRRGGGSSASGLNIPAPFRFRRWSPISTGDGSKMPLSPTVANTQQKLFDNMQLAESSLYSSSSSSGVSHSYSSGSLGQMQLDDSNALGSYWGPHRGQMRLQSRRSQSREDLNSSLAEAHFAKV